MQTKSFTALSLKEFHQKVQIALQDDFQPGIAIIFSSVSIDFKVITEYFKQKGVAVFGCSTCGEFLYNKDGHAILENSIICVLLELQKESYHKKLFDGENISSLELGHKLGSWAKSKFKNPALFVLASGLLTDGEQLVTGIQEITGDDIKIYGGLAGDDVAFKQTFVFSEDEVCSNGSIALVIDADIFEIHGIATSGWVSIGADKIITESEGNIVYTIDNEPALDVYKSYLNVNDEDLPEIGVEYPLLILRPGKEDLLRAVINVDIVKKALIFAGSVPEGSVVTFSTSPGFEIIDYTRNKINDFYAQHSQTDLLLLFSCMARHSALGPAISEEIEAAWQKWQAPLAGFFTYGEIGNNYNSSCGFHNETFTLVSIKQKTDA
jgi:hypothetical protein